MVGETKEGMKEGITVGRRRRDETMDAREINFQIACLLTRTLNPATQADLFSESVTHQWFLACMRLNPC
jgi:hypothetical protein